MVKTILQGGPVQWGWITATICEQVYIQGFGLPAGQPVSYCVVPITFSAAERKALDDQLERLTDEMGADDGNETEALREFAQRVLAKRKARKA